MRMNTPSDLVLTSEAARILGVSAQSVRQWERSGRLHATKTAGGVRLFSRTDVEEMRRSIDEHRHAVESTPGGVA
jgi:excisionase family DNA binding protein